MRRSLKDTSPYKQAISNTTGSLDGGHVVDIAVCLNRGAALCGTPELSDAARTELLVYADCVTVVWPEPD